VSLYEYLNNECQEYDIDILLADDGSTDNSRAIYQELSKKFPLKAVRHDRGPLGYGKTILTLFREAKEEYDLLITFDADLQHSPPTIKEIIQTFENNIDIDIISTSRYLTYRHWKENTKVPIDRYVTNMFLTRTINEIFDLNITDTFCGLKGYKTSILPTEINDAGYSFPLIFWNFCAQQDLKIKETETPIIYRLDRRPRGEWRKRMKEYFLILDSLVTSDEEKQIINQNYEEGILQITEYIDHHSDFPIYIYNDFFNNR
jgi:glycosyltransferase involved in cell wall biosynthesis